MKFKIKPEKLSVASQSLRGRLRFNGRRLGYKILLFPLSGVDSALSGDVSACLHFLNGDDSADLGTTPLLYLRRTCPLVFPERVDSAPSGDVSGCLHFMHGDDSAVSGSTPLPYHPKNHSLENPERAVSAILGTTREVSFLLAGTTRLTVGTSRAYLLKTAFLPPLRESTPLLRESTPLTRGRLGRCRGRLQVCRFFLFVPETSLKLSGDVSAVPDLFSLTQNILQ